MAIINLNTLTGATNSCSSPSNRWILSSWSAVTWLGASVTSGFPLKYKIGANGTWQTVTLDTSMLPFIINNGANDVFVDFDVYQTFNYPSQTPNPGQFYNYGFDTRLDFKYTDYCNSSPCGISSSYSVNSYNNTITYEKNLIPSKVAYQGLDVRSGINNIHANSTGTSQAHFAIICENNILKASFYRTVYEANSGAVTENELVKYTLPSQPTYTYELQPILSTYTITKVKFGSTEINFSNPSAVALNIGTDTQIADNIKTAILNGLILQSGNNNWYNSFSTALTVTVTTSGSNKIIKFIFKPYLYDDTNLLNVIQGNALDTIKITNGNLIEYPLQSAPVITNSSVNFTIPTQVSTSTYCTYILNSIVSPYTLDLSDGPCTYKIGSSSWGINDSPLNAFANVSYSGIPTVNITGSPSRTCSAVNQVKFKPNYDVNSITSYTVKQNGTTIVGYSFSNPTFINYSPSDNFEVTLVKTLPNTTSCTNTRTYSVSNPNF